MTLDEFIQNHYEDGEVYSLDENIKFKCVDEGDEQIDHKTVFQTSVYQLEGAEEYFEVSESWSNSGYWSDGESYDPEFRKVVPVKKIVEITQWKDA